MELTAIDLSEFDGDSKEFEGKLEAAGINRRLNEVEGNDAEFSTGSTFKVKLHYNSGNLRLVGKILGSYSQPCSRCSEQMKVQVDSELELFFRRTEDENGLADSELLLESEIFNLNEVLEDSLILQMNPFGSTHERCPNQKHSAKEEDSKTSLGELLQQAISKN